MDQIHVLLGKNDLLEFLEGHDPAGDYLAFDIETKGNRPFDEDSCVVGFSLADGRGAGYWTAEHWPFLLSLLPKRPYRLVAHNVFFDAAYVMRDGKGLWPTWAYCTYGLYKQIATEGWLGQQWSLKSAQRQLLGWEETNEKDLLQWLVEQGHITSTRKSLDEVKDKDAWFLKEDLGVWAKADKGKMYLAPQEILGKYCALDAHSTYLLLQKVLLPALSRFNVLQDYHQEVFLPNVRILIEQELSGILVDVEGLKKHAEALRVGADVCLQEFLADEEIAPHIASYNEQFVKKQLGSEPPKHNKSKVKEEPPKYTKTGAITKRWQSWAEEMKTLPPPSKRWEQWQEKKLRLLGSNHFNVGSGPQLAWLFYQQLEKPILLTTESGNPATDGKAMGMWGAPGALLRKRSKMEKELGYVESAISYQKDGIIYPQFRVPGTLTGRLSGAGSFSLHQQPKTREYLSLLKARPGTVWLDYDFVALEPAVLTELSRDSSMLKLYGPGVKPNDIYIFVGSGIPGIKETFTTCGYDPDNPTKESINRIKKEHKLLRAICKTTALAAQYGAGARKIHQTLTLQGIDKTFEEVQVIHSAYWKLFAGIKEYESFLQKCWHRNGGWVLNGIGRPLAVHRDRTKDLVNSVCQSTGHDIHMIGLAYLRTLLEARVKGKYSWIIADFHDEAILEVKEGYEDAVLSCFKEMEAYLNDLLKPFVPIKIDPAVGKTLADFKIQE